LPSSEVHFYPEYKNLHCPSERKSARYLTLLQKAINKTTYNPNKLIKEQIFKRVNSLKLRSMSTNLGLRSIAYYLPLRYLLETPPV
jgi:hypothetical protein